MNDNQRSIVKKFERNCKFTARRGGDISLATIIDDERSRNNPTNLALPEYMRQIHPWLYYYFIVDWQSFSSSRLPRGYADGIEFGRYVIKEWHKVCSDKTNRLYCYEYLSAFQSADELRDVCKSVFHDIEYIGPDGNPSFDFDDCLVNIIQARDKKVELEAKRAEEERIANEQRIKEEAEEAARQEAVRQEKEAAEARRKADEERRAKQNLDQLTIDCYEIIAQLLKGTANKGSNMAINMRYNPAERKGFNFSASIFHSPEGKYDEVFSSSSFYEVMTIVKGYLDEQLNMKRAEDERVSKKSAIEEQIAAMQRKHEEDMKRLMEELNKL